MRGEEKRSWWEHGGAGAHFPLETAVPRTSSGRPAGGGLPCGHIPGRSGGPPRPGAGWERASSPARSRAMQVHHPLSSHISIPFSQRRKCLPAGKLRRSPRRCPGPGAGQSLAAGHQPGQPSSSGHCRARTALLRREEEGEEVPGGGPGNCNSLWMGWTGRGGERSQASTSINLPSGRQAGAAAAPALPVSGMIQPNCAAPALHGQGSGHRSGHC